jgi:putative ABC transport system permease protein
VRNFDVTHPCVSAIYHQVLSVPGVARAEKFIVQFANWRKPEGGMESVEVVGFDLASGLGRPWAMAAGSIEALEVRDTVIIDELYQRKLGVTELGQAVEISDRRARVVGFTRGIRSFTTSPYVFTSFANALEFTHLKPDQLTYVLVLAEPGLDPRELRAAIAAAVDDVDVFTREEFAHKTKWYWMFTTGAGMALVIAACLGLVVGGVVVAQTLYATPWTICGVRHASAMGAKNVITRSSWPRTWPPLHRLFSGLIISHVLVKLAEKGGASILLTWRMSVGLFFLTVIMCVTASFVSIKRVTRIDPAMVFKGA